LESLKPYVDKMWITCGKHPETLYTKKRKRGNSRARTQEIQGPGPGKFRGQDQKSGSGREKTTRKPRLNWPLTSQIDIKTAIFSSDTLEELLVKYFTI
jgi:hypothetical protein